MPATIPRPDFEEPSTSACVSREKQRRHRSCSARGRHDFSIGELSGGIGYKQRPAGRIRFEGQQAGAEGRRRRAARGVIGDAIEVALTFGLIGDAAACG